MVSLHNCREFDIKGAWVVRGWSWSIIIAPRPYTCSIHDHGWLRTCYTFMAYIWCNEHVCDSRWGGGALINTILILDIDWSFWNAVIWHWAFWHWAFWHFDIDHFDILTLPNVDIYVSEMLTLCHFWHWFFFFLMWYWVFWKLNTGHWPCLSNL